jgi:putative transposase
VVLPEVWHHVTQRGNRRQSIFFEDADRHFYLQLLGRHCSKYGVAITGYCLMTNHVHVIASPTRETSLARAFGQAHTDYARWLNLRRGETVILGRTATFRARWMRSTSGRRCDTWN